jgi:DNA-binding winged helix-turn-helix (wHTH) protein
MFPNSQSSNVASHGRFDPNAPSPQTAERYPVPTPIGGVISFGEFRLAPATRTLTKHGSRVHLGARALDILIALVERAGQIVSNAELLAVVWPNMSIEESAQRVHISALRRALGDGRSGTRLIVSVRGRGYMFVAELERKSGGCDAPGFLRSGISNGPDYLPFSQVKTIERHRIIDEPAGKLPHKSFVIIAGAGGTGKVARSPTVAERLESNLRDDVRLSDARQLRDVMNQARRLLIVLDDCERAIEAASGEGAAQSNCELIVLAISSVGGPGRDCPEDDQSRERICEKIGASQ